MRVKVTWMLLILTLSLYVGVHQETETNLSVVSANSSTLQRDISFMWLSSNQLLPDQAEIIHEFPNLGLQVIQAPSDAHSLPSFQNGKLFLETSQFSNLHPTPMDSVIRSEVGGLDLDAFWSQNITGESIVVAVVDSGVNFGHSSLVGREHDSISFITTANGYPDNEDAGDDIGHGTGVASLVTGDGDGSTDNIYKGVAPNAKILNVKIADSSGIITVLGLLSGIEYAAAQPEVDIINLSLGGIDELIQEDILEAAVNNAVANGKIVVASAGNEASPDTSQFTVKSPGSAREAITVGAATFFYDRASFSSEGPSQALLDKPDVYAFGSGVRVAAGSSYLSASGTSYSTPIVSGAIALMLAYYKQNNQSYNPGLVKSLLVSGTTIHNNIRMINGSTILDAMQNSTPLQLNKEISHPLYPFVASGETISYALTTYYPIGTTSFELTISGSGADYLTLGQTIGNYTQIRDLQFTAPQVQATEEFSATLEFASPQVTLTYSLQVDVQPLPHGRILLDLSHTTMDAFQGSIRLGGSGIDPLVSAMWDAGWWVQESHQRFTEIDLTTFDMIFMPDAFLQVQDTYLIAGNDPSIKITDDELLVLETYLHEGGKLILDTFGFTQYDSLFTKTYEQNSLDAVLGILDMQVESYSSSDMIRSGKLRTGLFDFTNITLTGSGNQILGGVTLFSTPMNFKLANMQFSDNGVPSIVINGRYWRTDDAVLANPMLNTFFSEFLSFMEAGDGPTMDKTIISTSQVEFQVTSTDTIDLVYSSWDQVDTQENSNNVVITLADLHLLVDPVYLQLTVGIEQLEITLIKPYEVISFGSASGEQDGNTFEFEVILLNETRLLPGQFQLLLDESYTWESFDIRKEIQEEFTFHVVTLQITSVTLDLNSLEMVYNPLGLSYLVMPVSSEHHTFSSSSTSSEDSTSSNGPIPNLFVVVFSLFVMRWMQKRILIIL